MNLVERLFRTLAPSVCPPQREPEPILRAGWRGVDVSSAQKTLPPLEDLDFVIVKATEGSTFVSPGWEMHAQTVKDSGLRFGAYHFAKLGNGTARGQAEHFLANLHPWPDFAALDVEWSSDKGAPTMKPRRRAAWIRDWIRVVEAAGLPVTIYMQASYYRGRLASHRSLHRWPLWQAGRHTIPEWPAMMVQRVGRLAGHDGRIDIDTVRGGWSDA